MTEPRATFDFPAALARLQAHVADEAHLWGLPPAALDDPETLQYLLDLTHAREAESRSAQAVAFLRKRWHVDGPQSARLRVVE